MSKILTNEELKKLGFIFDYKIVEDEYSFQSHKLLIGDFKIEITTELFDEDNHELTQYWELNEINLPNPLTKIQITQLKKILGGV